MVWGSLRYKIQSRFGWKRKGRLFHIEENTISPNAVKRDDNKDVKWRTPYGDRAIFLCGRRCGYHGQSGFPEKSLLQNNIMARIADHNIFRRLKPLQKPVEASLKWKVVRKILNSLHAPNSWDSFLMFKLLIRLIWMQIGMRFWLI